MLYKPPKSKTKPNLPIDWDLVDRNLMAGVGAPTIAAKLHISDQTLYRRCKTDRKMDFVELRTQKLAEGSDALISKGFTMALSGDRTMLIFYLKNRAGFADRTIVDATVTPATEEAFVEAMNRIAEAKNKRN